MTRPLQHTIYELWVSVVRVVWNQKIFRVLQCFYILYWSDFKWLKLHNWYSANHNDFHLFSPQPFSYTSTNSRQLEHFPAVTTKGRITGQWWHCCHITKSIYVSFPYGAFVAATKWVRLQKPRGALNCNLDDRCDVIMKSRIMVP